MFVCREFNLAVAGGGEAKAILIYQKRLNKALAACRWPETG